MIDESLIDDADDRFFDQRGVDLRVWAVRHGKPGPARWLLVRRSLG